MSHSFKVREVILVRMSAILSTWLNTEAKRRGWSLRYVAGKAGLSHSTVARIANGELRGSERTCRGLARAFNMRAEDLMRLAELMPPESPEPPAGVDGLIQRLQQLPESDQQAIIGQMDALLCFAESRPVYNTRSPKPTTPEP